MTREESIKGLKENLCSMCAYGSQNMDNCDIRECDNRDYVKALEQEPCEDCISREAVLDAINKYIEKAQSRGTRDDFISFEYLVVKDLPSVQPKAKWIPVSERLPKIADVYRVTRYYPNNVMNPNYLVDACFFDVV